MTNIANRMQAPVLVFLLIAVSLPIVFHMFRRTPSGRQLFSTLMFLDPSPPRITRRARIENWPLLRINAVLFGFQMHEAAR